MNSWNKLFCSKAGVELGSGSENAGPVAGYLTTGLSWWTRDILSRAELTF